MADWYKRSLGELNAIIDAAEAGGGGGASLLHQATVLLTNAQIKASPTTAPTILAAPGAGKVPILARGFLILDTTAGAYTNVDAGFSPNLALGDGLGDASNYIPDLGGKLAIAGIALASLTPPAYPDNTTLKEWVLVSALADLNAPFKLSVWNGSAGDLTGGHASNTLRVSVTYYVLDVTTGIFE